MRLAGVYRFPAGEDNCPADKLMFLFRTNSPLIRRDIYFSQSSIDFFKEMADGCQVLGKIYLFSWEAVMEQGLPPLTVKVTKEGKRYKLMYLLEKVNYSDKIGNFPGRQTLLINDSALASKPAGELLIEKEVSKPEKYPQRVR